MKKKMDELTRRHFIGTMGSGAFLLARASPLALVSQLIGGMVEDAAAATLGSPRPVNYLGIHLVGAPARWNWDLPLRPNGNDVAYATGLVPTAYGTSIADVKHTTTTVGGYTLSSLWNSLLPTSAGGTVSMKALADHMIMMRGLAYAVDGHNVAQDKANHPVGNAPSLDALSAENSTLPFPAVTAGGVPAYYSPSRKAIIEARGTDPIIGLMDAFKTLDSYSLESGSTTAKDAIAAYLGVAKNAATDGNPLAKLIYGDRERAGKLILDKYDALTGVYSGLVSKYRGLLAKVFQTSALAGIDNYAITDANSLTNPFFGIGRGSLPNSVDLRTAFKNTTRTPFIDGLAERMAIAEFLFTEGLTSSFSMKLGHLRFYYPGATSSTISDTDAHDTGKITSVYLQAMYFRAISTCLYELMTKLKATTYTNGKDMFSNTVVCLHGEFGRRALADGSGSNHGPGWSNMSILSGKVQSLAVIGNIQQGEADGSDAPGRATAMASLGYTPGLNDVGATVASALQLATNPFTAGKPLVKVVNDVMVPATTEAPKNVV